MSLGGIVQDSFDPVENADRALPLHIVGRFSLDPPAVGLQFNQLPRTGGGLALHPLHQVLVPLVEALGQLAKGAR